ncbi:MAG: PaaX family transcriptional regulator C-terminal domain-containing protein [Xanthobacteraceae bacterium]|nr:PaaX family transcriptional regulator C-terminal domain-containing protein [Xanthobacteraceae bacterium]
MGPSKSREAKAPDATIAVDEIIAGREPGGHEQPAHHRYVVTVFGLYGRPAGKVIPVAALVRLLSELGHEPASVRSSISRLKKKGVLVSRKMGGASGYALAGGLEPHMLAGDERIFSPRTASIGDPWLLASFSVPESERQNRHKIRSGLARLGFGNVAPGLCIAPARLQIEALNYMREHNLSEYVEFFTSQPVGPGDLRRKVAQWWDLDAVEGEYRTFVDAFGREADRWLSSGREVKGVHREAFRIYVPMVTQWRRLPFMDPGLPPELLPARWMGITARRVFGELNRVLRPMSAHYVDEIIRG